VLGQAKQSRIFIGQAFGACAQRSRRLPGRPVIEPSCHLNRGRELLGLPRLLHHSGHAEAPSLPEQGRVFTLAAGDHDWGMRMRGPQPHCSDELDAVHARHLAIQHDYVEGLRGKRELGEGAIARLGLLDLELRPGKAR
jgi:hypothetical protein